MSEPDGTPIERRYKYIGESTNNIAEYTAIQLGIQRAIELGATDISLYADSELAIKQLSGEFRVKNAHIRVLYDAIQEILRSWGGNISLTHITREKNTEADRLSNVAMDEGEKKK